MLADDVQRCPMRQSRRSRKTVHLPAYIIESDQIGTPKEELNVALTQLRADCAYPAPLYTLSFRTVTRISETLKTHYQRPDDLPWKIHALSLGGISEVLGGKRQRLSKFDWVAIYVLACQRHAVEERPGRRDQGTTILPHWKNIYAVHEAEAAAGAPETGRRTPAPQDGPAGSESGAAYQLPQCQQDFVLTHGPYGKTLLARAQRGHPHARYRVALLLACDPALSQEAVALLIDVASTGHPLSLDVLDACRDVPAAAGTGAGAAGPLPQVAARCAWDLARTAWDHGAGSHGYAFCRAAARGGLPEAVLKLGEVLLTDSDPEAAGWLAKLGTEEVIGRHHSGS